MLAPRAFSVFYLAVSFTGVALAQSVKVSGPLARVFGGTVLEVQLSPDGLWAVYKANPGSDDFELFSVRTTGGAPIDIGGEQIASNVRVRITADSRLVVFEEWSLVGGPSLYVVPIDGSRSPERLTTDARDFELLPDASGLVYLDGVGLSSLAFDVLVPLPLTEPLVPGGRIHEFRISPDGGRVVYIADALTNGVNELFSVPIDASRPPLRLNPPRASNGHVREFEITADGLRVVYRADLALDGEHELHSVPIDADGPDVTLNGPLPLQGDVEAFEIRADGQRVVYRADQEVNDRFELFGVHVAGGTAPVRLNGPLVMGGDVAEFAIAPDGRLAVYVADQATNERSELFAVAVEGGSAPIHLNHPLGTAADVSTFQIAADSRRLVYFTRNLPGMSSFHRVSLVRRSPPMPLATGLERTDGSEFKISPTGDVVYRAEGFFSVQLAGGVSPVRLDDGGGIESGFVIAPDGTVLYRADRDREETFQLFGVPADASRPPLELSPLMAAGQVIGDVGSPVFSPDGNWAVFGVTIPVGSHENTRDELYSVRLAPRSWPIRLFPRSSTHEEDLRRIQITPDGQRVLFVAGDDDGESSLQFLSVPIDGHLDPELLNDPAGSDYGVGGFALGPDGSTAFYSQDGLSAGIHRVPLDGSSTPDELTPTSPSGRPSFALTPDGTRIVYQDAPAPGERQLFSVLADGSAPPIRLDDRATYPFQITPDGTRVVYPALAGSAFEVFIAPIDGSASPLSLSGTPVAGGNAGTSSSLLVTPDGTRVVYAADALTDSELDLFSAPLDGSAPPVQLNDVVGPRAFSHYQAQLVADGSRVVYLFDQEQAGLFELFAVPVDGAAPPLRLNQLLVAGGDVADFQVDASGGRVVYRADAREDERFELFAVAPGGGEAPLRLDASELADGDVMGGFRITPDEKHVVFVADHDGDEVLELYAAPLDREKAAIKLNGPLVAGGDVLAGNGFTPLFQIAPDSMRVLYLADQDCDHVIELYLTSIGQRATLGGRTARVPGVSKR